MARRSSTSSSSRAPWAAVLAALLLFTADRVTLGPHGAWQALVDMVPTNAMLAWGVVRAQSAIQGLEMSRRDGPRVFVVGSSRAWAGFDPELAGVVLPAVSFARIAQAGLGPFEIDSYVHDMLSAHPDAVVLVLSEVDTHRPLRLEPVPATSAASLAAVADLIAETGFGFALHNRTTIYRVAAAATLNGYRFREVLRGAGADRVRTFALDKRRFPRRRPVSVFRPGAMWEGSRATVTRELVRSVRAQVGARLPAGKAARSLGMLAEISPGRHAEVQMGLVRRAIERLQAGGVEVIIVEAPLHPAAAATVNPASRREFTAFASALAADDLAHFVALEHMAPFPDADFNDLLHLSKSGARKLTIVITEALRERQRVLHVNDAQGHPPSDGCGPSACAVATAAGDGHCAFPDYRRIAGTGTKAACVRNVFGCTRNPRQVNRCVPSHRRSAARARPKRRVA